MDQEKQKVALKIQNIFQQLSFLINYLQKSWRVHHNNFFSFFYIP